MRSDRIAAYVFASVLISALLHLAAYGVLAHIHMMGLNPTATTVKEKSREISFETITVEKPKLKTVEEVREVIPSLLPPSIKIAAEPPKPPAPVPSAPSMDSLAPSLVIPLEGPTPTVAPILPKTIEIDGDRLSAANLEFNQVIVPKMPRSELDFVPSGFSGFPSGGSGGAPVPGASATQSSSALPFALMISPPKPPNPETPSDSGLTLLPPENAVPTEDLIAFGLRKFPATDGGGFFELSLSPNAKAARLKRFSKDVIFIIDVSGSISQMKLTEFKQGVARALAALQPGDRFEIVAFYSKVLHLYGSLAPVNDDSRARAGEFLNQLTPAGSTDIYSALRPYAGDAYKSPGRPLILFLMSDGNVNQGKIVDSRQLINDISNNNPEAASIFTFSCGQNANSFLLDLISYRNRGEYIEVPDVEKARKKLGAFLDAAQDVVVSDLSYQLESDIAPEAFPKKLPNLYRGHTLRIYGRYFQSTKKIGLRITGFDSVGTAREIVWAGELSKAEAGDVSLPKKWARQRIYHLYSLLTAGYNPELRSQILQTAEKFDVRLPFLEAHLTP